MKRVLILYNKLWHYRIPIFNILSKKYDLTVAYCYESEVKQEIEFKTIKLTPYTLWKFTLQKENIFKICQQFDVVIAYGEIAYLKYTLLPWHKGRRFKILFYGIGAPASYKRHYGDASKLHFRIVDFFERKADGLIFYSDYAVISHEKRGFDTKHLYVANNTVEVVKMPFDTDRNSILFIGTLYLEKGLQVLLDAYKHACEEKRDLVPLNLVGGGKMETKVRNWIEENGLSEKIHMFGAVYDKEQKAKIFSKAYACISPNQAGLSVLESMGYGVPFITTKNAITGGELFNLENNSNGLSLDSMDDLKNVLLDISINPNKYVEMGRCAYDYYWACRKPQDMAQGLMDAIEGVYRE